ncbi:MAG: hypothetical protein ACRDTE_13745 [Pseudonocardiaceae bacterium]
MAYAANITLVGVDRQQFIRAGVGAGAVAGSSALLELLPDQATRVPSVVGMTQVSEPPTPSRAGTRATGAA